VLQTPQTNLVMDKNPLVDCKVSIRRLGEKPFGLRMVHARSDGDINRGVTVSVSLVSTVRTLEGSLFPYAFASAFGANMRCSSWMDCNHKPVVLPSYRFECHSEPAVGHTFSFAVTLSVSSGVFKPLEVFDGYEGIVFFSELYDFMSYLPASSSGVVAFTLSQSSQCLLSISASIISVTPQFASSEADVSLPIPHILSEIELLQDSALKVDYGDCCQPFGSNIDSNHRIIIFVNSKLLFENHMDSIAVKPEESGFITLIQKVLKPSVSSIHSDWSSDSSVQGGKTNHWIAFLCQAEVSASRNVEGDCNIPYFSTVVQYGESVFEKVISHLAVDPVFSDFLVEKALKFHSVGFNTLGDYEREGFSICFSKVVYYIELSFCGLQKIQGYGFNDFHPKTTRKIDFQVFEFLQFLPCLKNMGFLGEEMV